MQLHWFATGDYSLGSRTCCSPHLRCHLEDRPDSYLVLPNLLQSTRAGEEGLAAPLLLQVEAHAHHAARGVASQHADQQVAGYCTLQVQLLPPTRKLGCSARHHPPLGLAGKHSFYRGGPIPPTPGQRHHTTTGQQPARRSVVQQTTRSPVCGVEGFFYSVPMVDVNVNVQHPAAWQRVLIS